MKKLKIIIILLEDLSPFTRKCENRFQAGVTFAVF
jgi:hypothetical protein